MILFVPSAKVENSPAGSGKRIRMTSVVDETSRTVVAERVQRADTFLTRLVGLLGRDLLPEDEALWISPCKGIHTIGMSFPIDAVFLDRGHRVVAVHENVAPWRATGFVKGASSVLELTAGAIRRAGVSVGHQLEFVPAENEREEIR